MSSKIYLKCADLAFAREAISLTLQTAKLKGYRIAPHSITIVNKTLWDAPVLCIEVETRTPGQKEFFEFFKNNCKLAERIYEGTVLDYLKGSARSLSSGELKPTIFWS